MMYIGSRPVVNGKRRVIEVNIFDFNQDIYDSEIEITLHQWIRGDVHFNGLEALKNQLAIDQLKKTAYHDQVVALEQEHKVLSLEKQDLLTAMRGKEPAVYSAALHGIQQKESALRLRVKKMVKEN